MHVAKTNAHPECFLWPVMWGRGGGGRAKFGSLWPLVPQRHLCGSPSPPGPPAAKCVEALTSTSESLGCVTHL